MKSAFHFAIISAAAMSIIAHADSLPIDPDATFSAGMSVTHLSSAYDADAQTFVLPQAFYDNNRVYIEGTEAGIYPYKDNRHHLRAGISYDGRNFDPEDAHGNLAQLNERKSSALAHISYMYLSPIGGLRAKATTDLLDKHGGQTLSLAHVSKFTKDDWTIYPSFGATWRSEDYNNYYYGVSDAESVRSGVAAYQAKSSWSPFVSATVNYQATPRISVFINQNIEWLSDTQKSSPMASDDIESRTRVGFNYQF